MVTNGTHKGQAWVHANPWSSPSKVLVKIAFCPSQLGEDYWQ